MNDMVTNAGVRESRPGGFLRFAGAVGLANTADGIAIVVWAWTATLLTRDPLLIALLPAALRVPWVVFALPSGILADRADRRRLIVTCDLVRAGAYTLAGAAILSGLPLADPARAGVSNSGVYVILLGLGFVIGSAEVARDNAAQTLLPSIIPPGRLEQANGRLHGIEIIGNSMIGPAMGSFLIAFFLPLPFFVVALAFFLAALAICTLAGRFQAEGRATRPWRQELRDGFRYVLGQPMLRTMVLITGFWNFFAEMALIGLVLHIQENLGAGPTTYGLILAGGAVGGVIGGAIVVPLLKRVPRGRLANCMNVAAAPLFVGVAAAPGPLTVGAAMFFFYLSGVIWNTLSISYRQRVVPDALRGRVNSVYRLFAWGMMPMGLIASGLVVRGMENITDRNTALLSPFLVAALGIGIVALLSWRPLNRGFMAE